MRFQRFVVELIKRHRRVIAALVIALSSPGSIYNYTHGEALLVGPDTERIYAEVLLPLKLALDTYYIEHMGFLYDLKIVASTVYVILCIACGRRTFPLPPEWKAAGLPA